MRIDIDPRLPKDNDITRLKTRLYDVFKSIAVQLNGISEGRASASYAAYTAAPTTGTYAVGDTVKNSAPSEAGSAGSKYVITGWICTASGTPGTWLQMRTLTGN